MLQNGWMKQMLSDVDAKDADAFARWFTSDGVMRYGSGAAMVGPEAIRAFCAGFFGSVKGLSHRVIAQWDREDRTICQGECTYRRLDDRSVTLPFMTMTTRRGDRLAEYLVYLDAAPLFAP